MNDRCTPATAARLKAAGFPQPDPAPGQVWYKEKGDYIIIGFIADKYAFHTSYEYGQQRRPLYSFSDLTFAPGVADLLRVLGGRACISEDSDKRFAVANNLRIKIDWEQISGTAPDWQWFDENPAEALAAAWLSENGNPADLDEF